MHSNYSVLLTDLYQLTMAYGYFKLNMHHQKAAFHLIYRNNPFNGNYALCCGLATVIDFLNHWHIQQDELDYLRTLKNPKQKPLFSNDFLDYLATLTFSCDLYAIPEGTVVFPNLPLLRIEGPLLQCQLLESPLLNIINFQTLIATKASRVCQAAKGDEVIEFGLRRAQGPDGAMSASRAAYIGGCHGTSNTLAGKTFDIPVRGTHAHSWVTAFPNELAAFQAYASVMPENCVFLVDTYQTLAGVKNAIEVGKTLLEQRENLLGIRLDSGEMARLSQASRKLLDEAGFKTTRIMASNTLDEYKIKALKENNAAVAAWGVGTNLVTAYDQPALDGVYKLSALCNAQGEWEYKLKLSEQEIKISNPGRHQVRRYFDINQYKIDVIYDLNLGLSDNPAVVLLNDATHKTLDDYDAYVDLLIPVFNQGQCVYEHKSIHVIRQEAVKEIDLFCRTHGDKTYPVALEKTLYELKEKLIKQLRVIY